LSIFKTINPFSLAHFVLSSSRQAERLDAGFAARRVEAKI